MAKFWKCEKCGSNLDFGERCDCDNFIEIHTNEPLPFDEKPTFEPIITGEQLALFPITPRKKRRK